jgi:ubiquinone/menaquinone biosynthesis C-methylase UbiE
MEAADYRRASHAVWEAMAPGWDERHAYFEEVARPVTAKMLELLDPSPGDTILELAAGTGVVGFSTAALVGPTGRVVVSDFAAAMVEVASRRARELGLDNVECRVLDGEHLELPDASVDGVVCRWGYMLMADVAAALRETRRVLQPGGRVTCAVFAGPEQNPWAAIPSRVLQQSGHIPPPESLRADRVAGNVARRVCVVGKYGVVFRARRAAHPIASALPLLIARRCV